MTAHERETTIRIILLFTLALSVMAWGCWKYRHPEPQPKEPFYETNH